MYCEVSYLHFIIKFKSYFKFIFCGDYKTQKTARTLFIIDSKIKLQKFYKKIFIITHVIKLTLNVWLSNTCYA